MNSSRLTPAVDIKPEDETKSPARGISTNASQHTVHGLTPAGTKEKDQAKGCPVAEVHTITKTMINLTRSTLLFTS
jgi:hypothetical protein